MLGSAIKNLADSRFTKFHLARKTALGTQAAFPAVDTKPTESLGNDTSTHEL